jgi:hypothetical protein
MAVGDVTRGLKVRTAAAARVVIEKLAASLGPDATLRTSGKRLIVEARRIAGRLAKDEGVLRAKSAYTADEGLLLVAALALFDDISRQAFAATAPNLPSKVAGQRHAAEALLTRAWNELQYLAEEHEDLDLLKKLADLREGNSLDDTVNDLELTAPLLRTHAKRLAAAGAPGAVQTAKQLDTYRQLLAAEQGQHDVQDTYNSLKQRRDRLGCVLEAHLARLRRHGKQAFRDAPQRAAQYVDLARSVARSKQRTKNTEA